MNFLHKIPIFFWSWFYPCKVLNRENIPNGGAILACNHFRAIDCGFVARVYSKDIYFLAKKEIFKNKLISKVVKSYGAIPIDRENPDLKSMLVAVKVLKNGHKLCIFPEGKRNTIDDNLQEIKGGTVVFAVKSKTPIVPMMISGKAKIFRRTYVIVGKPFELSEFYDKKLTDEDIDLMGKIVSDKMNEQKIILDNFLKTKKKRK